MPYADRERNREAIRAWRAAHPDSTRDDRARERDRLRFETLVAYSGPVPACACCGEDRLVFLTLDHIDGGGNAERRMAGHRGGPQWYRLLRRTGYPPGLRVLCWNCNFAVHRGVCPHSVSSNTR